MSEKPSFFAELKRRNVYKVAVAYAVVGWLFIQIASIVLPTFHAPEWTLQAIIALVVIGFPAALIFSWAFEITPEGIVRESEVEPNKSIARRTGRKIVAITAVLAVIAAGLFVFQVVRSRSTNAPRQGAGPARTDPAIISSKSIAVLPFDNLSRDPDNAYFAEGVQDEILTRLAKVADLKVIARTSTQKFKSAPEDLPDIAKQLGVANILEGSVQKAKDQVRVNVQLINPATSAHLWGETYDRKLTDIFAVESEIAETIADSLQAKLTGSEKLAMAKKPTENPEAYELYLKGRFSWNRRTEENLKQALNYFQQAIAKDPAYALAYAGVADCYSVLPLYVEDIPNKYIPLSLAAARRAVELDDKLAEAHTSLANALVADLQLSAGEAEFKQAIALNPNYATAHQWLGQCFQTQGRFDEALVELQRARELDPLSLIINSALASVLDCAGRYDEARLQIQRVIDLDANFGVAQFFLGQILEDQGRLDEAIAAYLKPQNAVPHDAVQALIACIYARTGRSADARKILNDLVNESRYAYVSSYALAEINAALGDKDEALRLLEKSFDERNVPLAGNDGSPKINKRFDSLRSDPRFQKLLAKLTGEAR